VRIPNLIVAGWWDQEDFYGPLAIYRNQEKGDSQHRNFLVIGPWNHGGWGRGQGDHYGPFDLVSCPINMWHIDCCTLGYLSQGRYRDGQGPTENRTGAGRV
jgi:hypothetical protein